MSKRGMEKNKKTYSNQQNRISPVPKIERTVSSLQKVYQHKTYAKEKDISSAYPAIDTDLARDNIENHLPEADLNDL